jgi:hypothetical protein
MVSKWETKPLTPNDLEWADMYASRGGRGQIVRPPYTAPPGRPHVLLIQFQSPHLKLIVFWSTDFSGCPTRRASSITGVHPVS